MFDEVALEAWLTLDSCYLIGWNQKDPRGDHGEWGPYGKTRFGGWNLQSDYCGIIAYWQQCCLVPKLLWLLLDLLWRLDA